MPVRMHLPFERAAQSSPTSLEETHVVTQFLYHEALLLDERRFADWFALLADDLHYYAPTRYSRTTRERGQEWAGPRGAAHFDDNKSFIRARIKRLATERAWSEDPPSRTRHFVSNVLARKLPDGAFEVDSALLVFRGRGDYEQEWFSAARHDLLRPSESEYGFALARRVILFDHTSIPANNLGIFF